MAFSTQTDRWFYYDVCSGFGCVMSQRKHTQTTLSEQADRYVTPFVIKTAILLGTTFGMAGWLTVLTTAAPLMCLLAGAFFGVFLTAGCSVEERNPTTQ